MNFRAVSICKTHHLLHDYTFDICTLLSSDEQYTVKLLCLIIANEDCARSERHSVFLATCLQPKRFIDIVLCKDAYINLWGTGTAYNSRLLVGTFCSINFLHSDMFLWFVHGFFLFHFCFCMVSLSYYWYDVCKLFSSDE